MKLLTANIDRLDLSTAVLAHWHQILQLGGLPSDYVRLAENEVSNLRKLRDEDPERVDDLCRRYQAIADQLKRDIN